MWILLLFSPSKVTHFNISAHDKHRRGDTSAAGRRLRSRPRKPWHQFFPRPRADRSYQKVAFCAHINNIKFVSKVKYRKFKKKCKDLSAWRLSSLFAVVPGGALGVGVAIVESVAWVAGRTAADGHAVAHLAVGVGAARQLRARVAAVVVEARPVGGTVLGGGTLALAAAVQRVADVAGRTRADGTVTSGVVVAGRATRVGTARVGIAQVGWGKIEIWLPLDTKLLNFSCLLK